MRLKAALAFLLSPVIPGSYVIRMRPGSPCGFIKETQKTAKSKSSLSVMGPGGEGSMPHCRAWSGKRTVQARGLVEGVAATWEVGLAQGVSKLRRDQVSV